LRNNVVCFLLLVQRIAFCWPALQGKAWQNNDEVLSGAIYEQQATTDQTCFIWAGCVFSICLSNKPGQLIQSLLVLLSDARIECICSDTQYSPLAI
jgi:hypothetical protein